LVHKTGTGYCTSYWSSAQHNSQTILPTFWNLIFLFTKIVVENRTPNLWKILLSPPFGYYYKYTTQDLPKLLRIKLFIVPTVWLLLKIHNSRFTEIVENQTPNLWKIVYCPDHLVTITNAQLKVYFALFSNCWNSEKFKFKLPELLF